MPAGLQVFCCRDNQITKIENLPASLQRFYCGGNQITKIENLPASLQQFDCWDNDITHVDDLELHRFNGGEFDLKMYNAIKRIQKRIRRRVARRHSSTNVIQKGCYNWIWKPVTKDGKLGVDLMRAIRNEKEWIW